LKNAQFPSQFHSWGFGIRAKWVGLYVGKGGTSWDFKRSVFEGRFEILYVATPLLEECEDDTHTPEMGTWESTGLLKF